MTRGHFIPRLIERIEVRKDYKDSCIVLGNQLDPRGLKLLVIPKFIAKGFQRSAMEDRSILRLAYLLL
jgi:hypothetical protein